MGQKFQKWNFYQNTWIILGAVSFNEVRKRVGKTKNHKDVIKNINNIHIENLSAIFNERYVIEEMK
ncbi:MAG: hypothetical protein NZ893_02305 [Candidatus Aenigmarchaeota archaeon]|nr:hypothetical protein [Candidatus Aenigmarchaeota archaeon]